MIRFGENRSFRCGNERILCKVKDKWNGLTVP